MSPVEPSAPSRIRSLLGLEIPPQGLEDFMRAVIGLDVFRPGILWAVGKARVSKGAVHTPQAETVADPVAQGHVHGDNLLFFLHRANVLDILF